MEAPSRAIFDPITGLCVISAKPACPIGYRCVDKTYDQQSDADLWKDSFLAKKDNKKERYLCLTRYFPLENGRLNNVLDSIMVLQEKEKIPSGFALVESTYDTKEKAMKKKQLVVRMVPRFSVTEAICDVIILSGMKKAPQDFTLFGEISGLLLCYRKAPVPPASVKNISPAPGPYMLQQTDLLNTGGPIPLRPAPGIDTAKRNSTDRAAEIAKWSNAGAQTGASLARQASRTLRVGSHSAASAYQTIEDVPFRIGSRFSSSHQSQISLPTFTVLTPEEIRHQFKYDFTLERAYLASTDDMQEESRITRHS